MSLKTELAPYLETFEPGPLFAAYVKEIPREARLDRQLPGRSQRETAEEDSLHHPDGAGRSDAGRDAGLRRRLLPRLRLAARSDLATSRARGPFRLRLSDPAAPDIDPVEGPREVESDFTDLHAWAEVYLPGAGWIGFDVTSGMLTRRRAHPARRHAALPLRRADLRHGRQRQVEFDFEMSVKRIREAPRITEAFFRRSLGARSTRSARRSTPI